MTLLYIWLILNVFMGIMYWVLICQTKEWFNIFLFPLIEQNLRENGYTGIDFYLAYLVTVLFTLPYIIAHYTFLVLWSIILMLVDFFTERKKK